MELLNCLSVNCRSIWMRRICRRYSEALAKFMNLQFLKIRQRGCTKVRIRCKHVFFVQYLLVAIFDGTIKSIRTIGENSREPNSLSILKLEAQCVHAGIYCECPIAHPMQRNLLTVTFESCHIARAGVCMLGTKHECHCGLSRSNTHISCE